jgi:hypothetical protein
MIELNSKWSNFLHDRGETGMGYQVVTIVLRDGRRFEQVIVLDSHLLGGIKGREDIPFGNDDIQEVILTHDKWDFAHDTTV